MLGIFKGMGGVANQGIDDVGQPLNHLICDGPSTRDNGHEKGARPMYFG